MSSVKLEVREDGRLYVHGDDCGPVDGCKVGRVVEQDGRIHYRLDVRMPEGHRL
jgi:hypothetical protein